MQSKNKKYLIRMIVGFLAILIGVLGFILIPAANDTFYAAVLLRFRLAPLYFLSALVLFYLIDVFFVKRKYLLFFLTSFALLNIAAYLANNISPFTNFDAALNASGHFLGIAFVLTAAVYIRLIKDKIMHKAEWVEFKAHQTETELKLLRRQINPHFLFNTLNSIYLKCIENKPDAGEMILQLSDMLRYQLQTDKMKEISLKEELKFLQEYIFFEKNRLHSNITVNYKTDVDDEHIKIVPNLLITLIENTFKHGVPAGQTASVDIVLTVKNKTLKLTTENNIAENKNAKTGKLGLENLRKRLDFIFENRYELKAYKQNGKYFSTLEIKL